MKVIGITGGVGSGKSTVTDIMEACFHAFHISTDQVAHFLMEKDMVSYKLIVEYFGNEILDQDEKINRSLLGKVVYEDSNKLSILNSFTHPYVMEYVKKLIQNKKDEKCERKTLSHSIISSSIANKLAICNGSKVELICVETALPIQAGLKDFCDEIWYVYAPEEVRRERLRKSRNYSEQKIDDILKNQISEEEYRKASTHIINNNCSIEKIKAQIEVLLVK